MKPIRRTSRRKAVTTAKGLVHFYQELGKIIVTPRWEGSQPDLHVLQQINCFVTDTGRQFECVGTGLQVVMWLTPEQKRAIQKVRKLEFWW